MIQLRRLNAVNVDVQRGLGLRRLNGGMRTADVQVERDVWAEHFRLIGEGPGLVADWVWNKFPFYSPMNAVW